MTTTQYVFGSSLEQLYSLFTFCGLLVYFTQGMYSTLMYAGTVLLYTTLWTGIYAFAPMEKLKVTYG